MLPRIVLATAVAALLAGCATDSAAAEVACEQLVNQRLGAQLQHLGPLDGATVTGDGPYVVHSGYTEPLTKHITRYTCTVARDGDGWRLISLNT